MIQNFKPYSVRHLKGVRRGTGECLCCQEGGPPARQGWRLPPAPRRERRTREAVEPPDVESPEAETPIAHGGEGTGETEREEGGSDPTAMEMGE